MRDKSIEERIQAAQEQLTFIRINDSINRLVKDAACEHELCNFNVANACKGNEKNCCPGGSDCIGLCQSESKHCIEYDAAGNIVP